VTNSPRAIQAAAQLFNAFFICRASHWPQLATVVPSVRQPYIQFARYFVTFRQSRNPGSTFYRGSAGSGRKLCKDVGRMSDESLVRQQAREAIEAGRLPSHHPRRVWGGPGTGGCCAVCGHATEPHQIEFELDFGLDEESPSSVNYFAHSACFEAWKSELWHIRAGERPESSPRTAEGRHGLPSASFDGTMDGCEYAVTNRRGSS